MIPLSKQFDAELARQTQAAAEASVLEQKLKQLAVKLIKYRGLTVGMWHIGGDVIGDKQVIVNHGTKIIFTYSSGPNTVKILSTPLCQQFIKEWYATGLRSS